MSLVNFLLPVDKDVLGLWSSSSVPQDRFKGIKKTKDIRKVHVMY